MIRHGITNRLILLLICMFLSGCAALPPKNASSYNEFAVGQPDGDKAVLVLYRKVVPPLAYSVTATINEKYFVTLPNNSFAWKYLSPGEYEIKIKWPIIAMTFGKTTKISVEAGRYYFVNFGGEFNVLMTGPGPVGYSVHNLAVQNPESALQEIKKCCQLVPAEP